MKNKHMFNGTKNVIERRVMSVIRERISTAQKEYDEKCVHLDNQYQKDLENLTTQLSESKEHEADRLVKVIVGKVL